MYGGIREGRGGGGGGGGGVGAFYAFAALLTYQQMKMVPQYMQKHEWQHWYFILWEL